MMEQKPDNVIPFPGPKKKKEATNRKPTLFMDWENRNVMVSASLGSILLLAAIINTSINSMTEREIYALNKMNSPQQRSIACDYEDEVCRSMEALAKAERQENMKREIASVMPGQSADTDTLIGRKPNALEELRFGQLAGNYALTYTNGKSANTKYVKAARFVESKDSIPMYLNGAEKFLWKNSALLPVQFDTVVQRPVVKTDDNVVESYNLVKNSEVVAEAQFTLDRFGRLISMKVQKSGL